MRKLCVLAAIICFAQEATGAAVWIDSDVSIGSPIRDVDDAYALVLAFQSPEIRIAGLSTTYGNAALGHTNRSARNLVQRFGGGAGLTASDVFAGARSARDLGRRTAASDGLAAELEKRKLVYVALGPLTNLSTFLRLHPDLAPRIERVIFVGGQPPGTTLAFGPKRSFHIHDANVFKDPVATQAVLRSRVPLTLLPVETVSNLMLDAPDLRKLEQSGDAANYLSRRSRIWLWFWTTIVKEKGGAIFDAPAIIAVTKPELLSSERRHARIDQHGNLLVTRRQVKGARPVRYCTALDPGTKQFFMRRLMTPRKRGIINAQ
jgi:inosine-uridine nucleoside N-ribohydrolase